MPLFVKFGGSASDREFPGDPVHMLCDRFAFLPPPEKIVLPSGWVGFLAPACRRLSSVVPPEEWGRSFRVTSFSVKEGGLEIATVGGNTSVEAVLRKVRRWSKSICSECGTPGILFAGALGLRPHCPKCLHGPALLRDLEDVLGWRADLVGLGGMAVQVHRIPRTLRASFRQWLVASGLDERKLQPWDLEGWLRDLARTQKPLRREYA